MSGSESLSPFWMYNGVLGMGNGRAFKVSEPPNYLSKLQESQMVECICREINKIGIESQLTVHGNGFKWKILRMRKFCRSCPNRQPSPPKQTPRKRRSLMPRTEDTPKMSRVTRSSTFNLGNSRPEDFQMGRRRMNLRRSTQQQTLNNHWRL